MVASHSKSLFIFLITLNLSACAVGPNFIRPHSPKGTKYTFHSMPKTLKAGKGEVKQRLKIGKTISNKWWALFHSHELDYVVSLAIAHNKTIEQAKATLAAANESVKIAAGSLFPNIDAQAGFQRSKGAAASPPSNLYNVGATLSYMVDVFGETRRTIEQQAALADNQYFQLNAAYLSITGNVVVQSITLASLQAQLNAANGIIKSDRKNLSLVREKLNVGKAARIEVLTAQSQLENDLTQLPPLRQQIDVTKHALSVLVGRSPGEWTPPGLDIANLKLPSELPLTLPSKLVHDRPDILAAEATLHANSAAIGIATAQMFPNITLSGSALFQNRSVDNLFSKSNLIWNIAAGLTAPIFHGGSLIAQRAQAIHNFRASAALYQQTVLTAFGQVADTLRALQHDAELVNIQKRALAVARESLDLQRMSYGAGKTDLLLLLNAQRNYQQALQGYLQAVGQRYLDTAGLFVAMGGGLTL